MSEFNPPLEQVQQVIREECDYIAEMLCEKNEAYGNAVCNPIAIFSKTSPLEQIKIRIDDKLARIQRSDATALGEDAVFDTIGYLILYRVYDRLRGDVNEMKCPECAKVRMRSIVTEGSSMSTLMAYHKYYDEDGVYHAHDPNTVTTHYSCSVGHEFTTKSKPSCPNCDYGI